MEIRHYKARFKRLKKLHDFSFDLRHKLTPHRKAAITKAWNKYGEYLAAVESGRYGFIKTGRADRKTFSSQYPATNKGIIYNKPAHTGEKRKMKIVGEGKNKRIMVDIKVSDASSEEFGREITFYIPFPDDFPRAFIDELILMIEETLKPHYMSAAINGYIASSQLTSKSFSKYGQDLSDKLGKLTDQENPVTGLYLIYYKKRLSNKWVKEINKKIELLF